MFGPIGGSEFLLILALALLLFGPRKLPQIGKNLGRALAEFRGATQEFKTSLEREVELEHVQEVKGAKQAGVARGSIAETVFETHARTDGLREGQSDSGSDQPRRS